MEGHRSGAEKTDLRPSLPAELNKWRHLPILPQLNKSYPEFSTMLGLLEAAHHYNFLVINSEGGRFLDNYVSINQKDHIPWSEKLL